MLMQACLWQLKCHGPPEDSSLLHDGHQILSIFKCMRLICTCISVSSLVHTVGAQGTCTKQAIAWLRVYACV